MNDYDGLIPGIVQELAEEDGIELTNRQIEAISDQLRGDYRGLPEHDDPDIDLEQWANDAQDAVGQQLSDYANEYRESGQGAIDRLKLGVAGDNMPLELVVRGEIPLEYAIGVIEDGQVRYLTEGSVGKHPSQWVFEDEVGIDSLLDQYEYTDISVATIVESVKSIPEEAMIGHLKRRISLMEANGYDFEDAKKALARDGAYSTDDSLQMVWYEILDDEHDTGLLQTLIGQYTGGRSQNLEKGSVADVLLRGVNDAK